MADYTLNRTGAEIDAIGGTTTATSSLDSVPSRTYVNLCSLELPAGTYVINAQVFMEAGTETYNVIGNISTESATEQIAYGGYMAMAINPSMSGAAMSITRILTINATTTVYLVCRQSSSAALSTVYAARNRMTAVRVR